MLVSRDFANIIGIKNIIFFSWFEKSIFKMKSLNIYFFFVLVAAFEILILILFLIKSMNK